MCTMLATRSLPYAHHIFTFIAFWLAVTLLTKTVKNYICKHQLNDKQFTRVFFSDPHLTTYFYERVKNIYVLVHASDMPDRTIGLIYVDDNIRLK